MRGTPAWRCASVWKTLAGVGLAVAALAVFVGVRGLGIAASGLEPRDTALRFTDRSGAALGTVLGADGSDVMPVALERVSPAFLNAILAAEDARFYRHGPVDARAVLRSTAQAVRCRCFASGASTITMQLARMNFALPNSIRGKLLQTWYAWRIENASTKAQILGAYVNRVAMGGNVYGVEAAARTYFGMPASDLDLAQASLLAGIPNDPSGDDPREHWSAARARQRYVLERMVRSGMISAATATTAGREQLHLAAAQRGLNAAHVLFRLARSPNTAALAGGAAIRTTIDLPLQQFVEQQARQVVAALAAHDVTQAAALVVDNRTGEVLAYLGSLDYFDAAYLGRNDGVTALRQPGSTLKPFLYEYALERHRIHPDTLLTDVPTTYAIPAGQSYSPVDYDLRFNGPVIPRLALADSLNVPAVRVLSRVGVPAFLERLRALGFERLRRSPSYYGLGLTLGAGEVTLWDLAHAYVTMARSGAAIQLQTLAGLPRAPSAQIGERPAWQLVTDMLADRYARAQGFGIGSVVDMPFGAAVKTGTSSGLRDTWTVGFTPEYTVAVWVGNFSGAPMRGIAGVSGAGPLWNRIMLHLYARRDPPPFTPPHGYVRTRLCASTGSPYVRGCSTIVAEYVVARDLAAGHSDTDGRTARTVARDRRFDEWRATEGATAGSLRLLFPRDGDVFEDTLPATDPRRSQQRIVFVAMHPAARRLTWSIDGLPLRAVSDGRAAWTVQPGSWLVAVSDGRTTARVRFTVIRARPQLRRGFALR